MRVLAVLVFSLATGCVASGPIQVVDGDISKLGVIEEVPEYIPARCIARIKGEEIVEC